MTTTQQEEQQVTHIITVTECPTEPCAVYYTDTLSHSLLVICKNKKHADLVPLDRDTDIDIEKKVKDWRLTNARPAGQPETQQPRYHRGAIAS